MPSLIFDLQKLLVDALSLIIELTDANETDDFSQYHFESIDQNIDYDPIEQWVILIQLLRDSWLELLKINRHLAIKIAKGWFYINFSTFKRLSFFAASKDGIVSARDWMSWLKYDKHHWLWSFSTQREMCRLIVQQGKNLSPDQKSRLENWILLGPSANHLSGVLQEDSQEYFRDHMVWLRLAKLRQGTFELGSEATKKLNYYIKSILHGN